MPRVARRMLACLLCVFLAGCLTGSSPSAARRVSFYVAPNGNDHNPGTTRHPLASLEAARDKIRELRKTTERLSAVEVLLREGRYPRTQTFTLATEDSGTESCPVVYRAYRGERVSVTGGRKLDPRWCMAVADGRIAGRLDPAVRDKVVQIDLRSHGIENYGDMAIAGPMFELFCAGKRLPVARWPNEGWAKIGPVAKSGDKEDAQFVAENPQGTCSQYDGVRPARWLNAPEALLHGFWFYGWMDDFVPIASIDTEAKTITLARIPPGGLKQAQWFYALNLPEELDRPGEWYLDRAAGILYILPPDAFPAQPLVMSELQEPLLALDSASHVTFRGITFEAVRGVGAVIGGGECNRFAGCTIRCIGSDAVVVDGGKENGVLSCDIYEVGGMGVRITGGNRSTLEPAGNYVVNCHIHDYAQRKRVYNPAVRLYGVGHRIAHNEIDHAPHQAIAYDGNDHLIEFNEIHHVVLDSSDAGVIYTGCNWTFRGNQVRNNFFHDIPHGPGLGTVGVYLDDCCSSTEIFGNVFCDMLAPTFIGGGRDNVIVNNIFVRCDTPVHFDNRGLRWDHFRPDGPMYEELKRVPYDRPPWSTRYPALARILNECPQAPLGNVVIDNVSYKSSWRDPEAHCRATSEKNIDRPYMRIENNYVTDDDPGFVNLETMNLRLRRDSVVWREIPNFQPIPCEAIGPQRDEFRDCIEKHERSR